MATIFETKFAVPTQEDTQRAEKRADRTVTLDKVRLGTFWSWFVGLFAYYASKGGDVAGFLPLTYETAENLYQAVERGLLWDSYQGTRAKATDDKKHLQGVRNAAWAHILKMGDTMLKNDPQTALVYVQAIVEGYPALIAGYKKTKPHHGFVKQSENWRIQTTTKNDDDLKAIKAFFGNMADHLSEYTPKKSATTTTTTTTKTDQERLEESSMYPLYMRLVNAAKAEKDAKKRRALEKQAERQRAVILAS